MTTQAGREATTRRTSPGASSLTCPPAAMAHMAYPPGPRVARQVLRRPGSVTGRRARLRAPGSIARTSSRSSAGGDAPGRC
eukprot:14286372-Alexandrium_andersonii.AAC.1